MTSTCCTAGGVAGAVCGTMTTAYTAWCMHEPGLYPRIMQAPVRAGEGQGHRRSGKQSQCMVEVSIAVLSPAATAWLRMRTWSQASLDQALAKTDLVSLVRNLGSTGRDNNDSDR